MYAGLEVLTGNYQTASVITQHDTELGLGHKIFISED